MSTTPEIVASCTGVRRVLLVPSPICPWKLSPHANSVPSERRPTLWLPPPTTLRVTLTPAAGTVITWNGALIPPTVSVAVVSVSFVADAVWRTHTVWPLVMVVAVEMKLAVQPIE